LLDQRSAKGLLNRFIESVQFTMMEDLVMTTLTITVPVCPLVGRSLRDDLVQLWRNERARRQQRRLLRGLARLSPRLIADMGIDPDAARAAAEDSWDEWHPDRMLRSAPWI
jgi:uncharacterized protein YjiS (DUF1127 family)